MVPTTNISDIEAWLKSHVPMIEFAQLSIAELDQHHCKVIIPFSSQNQNHLKSMYFGALAIGADAAAGLLAYYHSLLAEQPVQILFKEFKANFLKRAYGDICFECKDEKIIQQSIAEAVAEKKRVNFSVRVTATQVENLSEPAAEFVMTLSIKS